MLDDVGHIQDMEYLVFFHVKMF